MWGQEHEPGSREKQSALSFTLSGSVRRSVLLYKMPNLARAHTDTWKTGIGLGAGAGRRGGWQHPAGVGIHTHCSSAVPAFKAHTFHLLNSHQDISPYPLPFSFFFHSGRRLYCAAGDLHLPLPSSLIFSITGVFPELLDPALVL